MLIIWQPRLDLGQVGADLGLIGFSQRVGLGQDVGEALHALEQGGVAERELELGGVEDVEDDHLVAAVSEMFQARDDPAARRRTGRRRSPPRPAS